MRTEKEFRVAITIDDPITYALGREKTIMSALNVLYFEKCYKGCYIEKILRITSVSECVIYNCDEGRGNVVVHFLASVITYARGDIIYAAAVKTVTDSVITFEGAYYAALATKNNKFPLRPGQKVPIIALNISYTPYQKMAMNAEIFMPELRTIVYSLGKTSDNIKLLLEKPHSELVSVVDEQKRFAEENSKGYHFFAKIQYALPTYPPPTRDLPAGVVEVDVLDLAALIGYANEEYYAVISPTVPPGSSAIWVCKAENIPEPHIKVNSGGHDDVLVDIICGITRRIEFSARMHESYSTTELRENVGVWAAYAAYKK